MRIYSCIFLIVFQLGIANAQEFTSAADNKQFWKSVKKEMRDFKKVFRKYKRYRLEISYTRVDRNTDNQPTFTNYHYGDSESYFYPASLVKLPMAIFTMEKLVSEFGPGTASYQLELDSVPFCNNHYYQNHYYKYVRLQERETLRQLSYRYHLPVTYLQQVNPGIAADSLLTSNTAIRLSKQTSLLSFHDLLQSMLVFSDNEAYNKLFDFVGKDFIYHRFKDNGVTHNWISRRLLFCSDQDLNRSIGYQIIKNDSVFIKRTKGEQAQDYNYFPVSKSQVGKAHYLGESRVDGPRDFSKHNRLTLLAMQKLLAKLIFHNGLKEQEKLGFGIFEQRTLIRYLGYLPRETKSAYDTVHDLKGDNYTNYLLAPKDEERLDPNLRIVNCVGQAYGFTSDCAYVMDTKNNREFFLAARIYTNKNEILGDDQYEYQQIAIPFLRKLGEVILKMEHARRPKVEPNLVMLEQIFK